jgi:hypothetical protein
MEIIIALILIVLTALFFIFRKESKDNIVQETPIKAKEVEMKNVVEEKPNFKIYNPKESLLNSFRKDRDLKNGYIYENGKYFLFYNEKSIFFGIFNNLVEKDPRIMSKNADHDVICDAWYSVEKK